MRRLALVGALAAVMALMAVFANPAVAQPVTGLDASYMSGKGEVPGPGDPDGGGTATIVLIPSQNMFCYSLKVSNIAPATAAHIQRGAFHEAGPIVLDLNPPLADGASSGCTSVEPALIGSLLESPERYYVNVVNAEFPNGAIRGQLSKTAVSSFSYG
jgi:hypothetical protein